MSDIKDHWWLCKGVIFWMGEAFPDEIEKTLQDVDDDSEDYAIGSSVESDDGDDI